MSDASSEEADETSSLDERVPSLTVDICENTEQPKELSAVAQDSSRLRVSKKSKNFILRKMATMIHPEKSPSTKPKKYKTHKRGSGSKSISQTDMNPGKSSKTSQFHVQLDSEPDKSSILTDIKSLNTDSTSVMDEDEENRMLKLVASRRMSISATNLSSTPIEDRHSLNLSPTLSRQRAAHDPQRHVVNFHLINGSDMAMIYLPDKSHRVRPNVVVRISQDDKELGKSKEVHNNINPLWDSRFTFRLTNLDRPLILTKEKNQQNKLNIFL
ncbi:hypothetical protein Ciccas_007958 [Cichlidogyrus casuarinus]|uniref:C2 domain-containing protein n=1 Tax=Cichlidogyrus casuarinus TaxID=1844966 RepID=A0ABD2Q246_9PLAT